MPRIHLIGFAFLVASTWLVASAPAAPQEPEFTSRKAIAARRDHDKATSSARRAYDGQVTAAQRGYLRELEEAQKATMRAGDLEEARKIDGVVAWLKRSLDHPDARGAVADRTVLTADTAVAAQRSYLAVVDAARITFDDARVAALQDYRTALDAALQPILRAGKDLAEAERIQGAVRGVDADLAVMRAAAGWVVLFRSRYPEDWDTFQGGIERYAIPLTSAPTEVRYLRLRRMDTHAAVMIPVTHEALGKAATTGRFGWCGGKVMNEGGLHLGIDSTDYERTFRDGGTIMVSSGRSTGGWGFGHKVHVNDAQYWSWAGAEIAPVVFEIAVTGRDLTDEERPFLLE